MKFKSLVNLGREDLIVASCGAIFSTATGRVYNNPNSVIRINFKQGVKPNSPKLEQLSVAMIYACAFIPNPKKLPFIRQLYSQPFDKGISLIGNSVVFNYTRDLIWSGTPLTSTSRGMDVRTGISRALNALNERGEEAAQRFIRMYGISVQAFQEIVNGPMNFGLGSANGYPTLKDFPVADAEDLLVRFLLKDAKIPIE